MKIGLLKYKNSLNIGDNIQTLAVAQHVEHTDHFVERDFLHQYEGQECVVVMNGWFTQEPEQWPPSDRVIPLFFGFHLVPEAAEAYRKHWKYLKKFEPIGCRDSGTADIIRSWSVEAYVSGCATMTFDERKTTPETQKVVLVDLDKRLFNRKERADYTKVSHALPFLGFSNETKLSIARDLLSYYRNSATHVITSRIHCALPCFAMGIPTLYCGETSYRTDLINIIGLPQVNLSKYRRAVLSKLPFVTPNFGRKKREMTSNLKQRLIELGVAVKAT